MFLRDGSGVMHTWGSDFQGPTEPLSETRALGSLNRLWTVRLREHRGSFLFCFDSNSPAIT